MKHANALLLEKMYANLNEGYVSAFLEPCHEAMTFQVSGKSKLAGKYTKATFESGFLKALHALSQGTHPLQVHDILASDFHAAVLGTLSLQVDSKKIEMRTVHIWRFENGVPLAWYEYPRDLYAFDAALGFQPL